MRRLSSSADEAEAAAEAAAAEEAEAAAEAEAEAEAEAVASASASVAEAKAAAEAEAAAVVEAEAGRRTVVVVIASVVVVRMRHLSATARASGGTPASQQARVWRSRLRGRATQGKRGRVGGGEGGGTRHRSAPEITRRGALYVYVEERVRVKGKRGPHLYKHNGAQARSA